MNKRKEKKEIDKKKGENGGSECPIEKKKIYNKNNKRKKKIFV